MTALDFHHHRKFLPLNISNDETRVFFVLFTQIILIFIFYTILKVPKSEIKHKLRRCISNLDDDEYICQFKLVNI